VTKNEKREQAMHASEMMERARVGKAAYLGLEIVLSRRATALMSEGCSTKECSTALQPRGYNHAQTAADNTSRASPAVAYDGGMLLQLLVALLQVCLQQLHALLPAQSKTTRGAK
jgi:hypothetical protein